MNPKISKSIWDTVPKDNKKAWINPAPSKFTQFVRGVKNDPSGPKNMLKNVLVTAASIAPIPGVGLFGKIGKFIHKKFPVLKQQMNRREFLGLKNQIKSKPVNFKGPNPAHKTGAGGNSYSTQSMMRKQKPGEEIYRGDGKWYRGDGSMGQNLDI